MHFLGFIKGIYILYLHWSEGILYYQRAEKNGLMTLKIYLHVLCLVYFTSKTLAQVYSCPPKHSYLQCPQWKSSEVLGDPDVTCQSRRLLRHFHTYVIVVWLGWDHIPESPGVPMWAREPAWLGFQWFRHQYVGSTFCNFGTYKTFDLLDRPDKNLRRRTCELYHKHWIKSFSISTKSFPCIQLADVFPSLSDQILAGFSIWYLVIISSWGTEEWRMMHLETAWDHRSYCSLLPLRPQHCAIPVLHFNKPGFFFQPSFVSGFLSLIFFFFPSTFLCWILLTSEAV